MRRLVAVLALAAMGACGGEPGFAKDDLPRVVLQTDEAPLGTDYQAALSGARSLDDFADDDAERAALEDAAFQEAYLSFFASANLLTPGGSIGPDDSFAVSYAILFDTAGHASEGLGVIKRNIESDGRNLEGREPTGLGTDAFGYYGDLQPPRPPAFVFAWRVGNLVQAIVAGGARNAIDEGPVRVLAARLRARAVG